MKRLLTLGLLLAGTQGATADQFHKLVKYECLPKAGRLVVSLKGAYNEEGKRLLQMKGPDEWNPWSLVDIKDDKNETRIIGRRSVSRTCSLADGEYHVQIFPSPGNENILGTCGVEMSVGVVIKKAERTVVEAAFEGDCHAHDPVVVEVAVRGGTSKIKRIPKDAFYK
jgi:hypothetical protein